jgi:TetR/AcrR family transcriptional regulator, repressor for uid operon
LLEQLAQFKEALMRKLDPIKHEQKRQEILAAAMRCFLRSGLSGASTAQICAEAGISPGHLYHYFESKDAIIAAMADARLEGASERFKQEVHGGGSVISALQSEFEQPANPAQSALFFEMLAESRRNPAIGKILHGRSRSMRNLIAEVIRHGQVQGEIQPALHPETAAMAILGLMDARKAVSLHDPKQDAKKVTALFKLFINGLLSSDEKTAKPSRTPAQRSRSA